MSEAVLVFEKRVSNVTPNSLVDIVLLALDLGEQGLESGEDDTLHLVFVH